MRFFEQKNDLLQYNGQLSIALVYVSNVYQNEWRSSETINTSVKV